MPFQGGEIQQPEPKRTDHWASGKSRQRPGRRRDQGPRRSPFPASDDTASLRTGHGSRLPTGHQAMAEIQQVRGRAAWTSLCRITQPEKASPATRNPGRRSAASNRVNKPWQNQPSTRPRRMPKAVRPQR